MTIVREGLLITLLDPVVASVDAASAGRPETLSYLPGAMLLGAVAARSYADHDCKGRAFDLFHSGALRFGDALPLDEAGRLGFPVPASLHRPKGAEADPGGAINRARDAQEHGQLNQYRDEAIALDGENVTVAKVAAMKTAIDAGTGRARDGQLFGVEALASGQRFWAEISVDDAALIGAVKAVLKSGDVLRLGRSRSAEYGRVRIEWTEAPPVPQASSDANGPLLLWALSDIALDPEAEDFASALGLEGAQIDTARSFTRLRRVWPYNGHWRSRGLERLVMQRGSVVALKQVAPLSGVIYRGLHQEIGCGRLMAAPMILDDMRFKGEEARALRPRAPETWPAGETPVFDLVSARRGGGANRTARVEAAKVALAELGPLYAAAADLAGASIAETGPGPTQWSAVRAQVSAGRKMDAVFGMKGVARPGDDDWGAATGRNTSFRSWLELQWAASESDPERLALIAKGAAEAVTALRESGEWRVRL